MTSCIPKHNPVIFPLDSAGDDLCVFWDVTPYRWIPGVPKECRAFIFECQVVEEFFLDSWTLPLGPMTHADTAVTFLENVGSPTSDTRSDPRLTFGNRASYI
jgi:hypothetical protein